MPKISVMMSIYKERLEWIKEAVESILQQTYGDFEFIIVVDNPEIGNNVINYISDIVQCDARIKILFNEKNIGLALSMNKALGIADGLYIARMDADDIAMQNRFEREVELMERYNLDIVSSLRIDINENGEIIGEGLKTNNEASKILPYMNCMCHPSVMIRRTAIQGVGGYRNFPVSQDYDLWLRMIANRCKFMLANEYLIKYRTGADNYVSKKSLIQFYTSEYQRKLYKQRIRKGKDDFSENDYNNWMMEKKIDKKIEAFQKAICLIEEASYMFVKKNPVFMIKMMEAFVNFPRYTIYRIRVAHIY